MGWQKAASFQDCFVKIKKLCILICPFLAQL
ncbi:hypothetical protein CsSME_00009274 [Camellia sinensis var. sinensis]